MSFYDGGGLDSSAPNEPNLEVCTAATGICEMFGLDLPDLGCLLCRLFREGVFSSF